jgi:ABC-type cobalamin/Fe3+-siderophores transport system ATPase subunit
LVEIKDLSFGFTKNSNLFSEKINPKTLTFIVGANGSGKTSLLKTIAGLLPPLSGTVVCSCKALYLQAHPEISDWLTGLDVFEIFAGSNSQWSIKEDVHALGVKPILKKPLHQLSLGEQKRIFLAAALQSEAELILFDEPLNSLDWNMELQMHKIFRRHLEKGRSFIVSAHHLQWVSRFEPASIWFLNNFARLKSGNATEVMTSPEVQSLFNFKVAFTDNPIDGTRLLATSDGAKDK